jgi:3-oxocholest-4-en-26-oate---CoA ligase
VDVSFGTVWEAIAAKMPDAVAISEPGRDYTYGEFENRSARLAAALADAGVGPGDKVGCYLYNGAAYFEAVFAAFKIGAVPVNANYRYTQRELSALLADADAAALIFSGELAANVTDAARALPGLRLLVRVGGTVAGELALDALELTDLLAATAPRPARPRPGSDELFMYTGGTTGMPKGVIWRQGDLMRSMAPRAFGTLGVPGLPPTLDEAVVLIARERAAGRTPVLMPVVPLMHATGLFNSMGALLTGGRVVLARHGRLDARHVWETVAAQRVRALVVAGNAICQPLADELVAAERAGQQYDLSSLESIVSSGTALSDRLKRLFHERTSVTISDALAASEGGPFAFAVTCSVADLPSRFFPAAATRVFTADGTPVEPGSGRVGMLAFSGPIPSGYYKDAEKTSATFRTVGGVRYTIPGDLVEVEADGAIRFLGRGSGVINTGGEKVHPQEVEDALLSHPDVTDAAVVGVPDETWGERVVAVVAAADGSVTETELRELVRDRLAGYKVPRGIVLLPQLPRTPTGKLEIAQVKRIAENGATPGALRPAVTSRSRDVLQPDLAVGDELAGVVGDVDPPQLLGPPLAERDGLDVGAARAERPQEVRGVGETDGDLSAVTDGDARPDARRAFHHGGVDAAMHDPPRGVVVRAEVQVRGDPGRGDLTEHDAQRPQERARLAQRGGFEPRAGGRGPGAG